MRAYLKVHGAPAPQCAPSSRPVAERGGDGAGCPMSSCGSWYTDRVHPQNIGGGFYAITWWSSFQVFYHIASVAYWKCTWPSSRRA